MSVIGALQQLSNSNENVVAYGMEYGRKGANVLKKIEKEITWNGQRKNYSSTRTICFLHDHRSVSFHAGPMKAELENWQNDDRAGKKWFG